MKNLSPLRLAFLNGTVLAVADTLLVACFRPAWYVPLIVGALTFFLASYLYYTTTERFIYKKIKLIYKLIYQTKATKKEAFFYEQLLPQKSLEETEKDVATWSIQKRQELEMLHRNEQFRKEFLSNLAHELRTPIFTVQGYVDTLLSGALDDPQVNKRFLSNASKSIDRLVRLIEDLNNISKLESGQTPIVKEHFLMHELISDVFDELSLQAQGRHIHMHFKKENERGLYVHADKQKIRQVLINLVENALKYGNDGGEIYASCYNLDDQEVYVEISDNGHGIQEEHLSRIFERFYRVDRSRNREIGGTGLGLSIVKHIIEAHGHTVTVRSKVMVGSSFGFTLSKGHAIKAPKLEAGA